LAENAQGNPVANYFLLQKPVFGPSGGGVQRELALYTGVLAGVIAQWLSVALTSGDFSKVGLFTGVVASIVTFPAIWQNPGLKAQGMSFVKWCIAFQNGFFWPALFGQIAAGFARP
jgi:hypothetical protein